MSEMAESAALASDRKKLHSKLDEILAQSQVLLGKLPTISSAEDATLTEDEKWGKGVEWLTSLWQNGLNGILVDQMGFGTILPTIVLLCRLKAKGLHGPYLIITSEDSASGMPDWLGTIRPVPALKELIYYGNKKDRAEMRKEFMHKIVGPDFPIILTTYSMAMSDKQWLPHYKWKYVVVDQSPEMKKWELELLDKLKGLPMGHKLLLIRSPFQNNLAELWPRLNFVLPDMFSSRDEFDSWFVSSGERGKEHQNEEEKRALLSKLHAILRPFLLSPMEEDIQNWVPQKKGATCYRIKVVENSDAISVTGSKDHAAIEGARTGPGSCQEVRAEVAFKNGGKGIPKNEMAESAALASDPKKLPSKLDEILAQSEVLLRKLPTIYTDATLTWHENWEKDIEWLASLWQNGLNAILVHQMKCGTLGPTALFLKRCASGSGVIKLRFSKRILFLPHLKGLHGPYLIITSDSGFMGWMHIMSAISLKFLLYMGNRKDRAQLRKEFMHKTIGPDFPIILTTYSMAMIDKQCLTHYKWKYVVVDQSCELKEREFELLDKLKGLPMGQKLLLIRSPFENNLAELWSRLNFVLPDMFSSREEFDSWFDFSGGKGKEHQNEEEKKALLSKLHAILRPFLLTQKKDATSCRTKVVQNSNAISVTSSKDHAAIEGTRTGAGICQEVRAEVALKNGGEGIPKNLQSSQYGLEGNKVKRPRRNYAPASPPEECNSSFQALPKPAVVAQVPKSSSPESILKSLKEIPELARHDMLRAYSALIRDDRVSHGSPDGHEEGLVAHGDWKRVRLAPPLLQQHA